MISFLKMVVLCGPMWCVFPAGLLACVLLGLSWLASKERGNDPGEGESGGPGSGSKVA